MTTTRGPQTMPGTSDANGRRRQGFATLLGVDLWERFGFFGMAAILVLYLTAGRDDGGLGMSPQTATAVFAAYMSMAFVAGLPGGWLADRVLGVRKAILVGAVSVTIGYLILAIPSIWSLAPGLALVVAGTGLVKPALAALVAEVGGEGATRREAAFSLFYVCIQISALIAPAVIGVVAERVAWPLGFVCAAVGMLIGGAQFVVGKGRLGAAGSRPQHPIAREELTRVARRVGFYVLPPVTVLAAAVASKLIGLPTVLACMGAATVLLPFIYLRRVSEGQHRLGGFVAMMLASSVFWMLFSQSGSVLSLFAAKHTDRTLWGTEIPASWFQSLHPLFVLMAAPVIARLWRVTGTRIKIPVKFSAALLVAGTGFVLMAIAASRATEGPVSPGWLITVYALYSCGEIALAPAGLALAAAVAPQGYTSRFLAVNGLFGAVGVVIGGQLFRLTQIMPLSTYFLLLGGFVVGTGVLVGACSGRLSRMLTT